MDAPKPTKDLRIAANWTIIIAGVLLFLIYFKALLQPFAIALIIWFLINQLKYLIGLVTIKKKRIPAPLRTLLQPFAIALIIWFLINQLKYLIGLVTIKKKRIPAPLRTAISILIISGTFYVVGDLLVVNLEQIINRLPQYELKQDKILKQISDYVQRDDITERLNSWVDSIEVRPILSGLVNSLSSMLGSIILIVIYIVFLLLEESLFSKKLKILAKQSAGEQDFADILQKVNTAISSYVNIKTLISLLTGVMSYIVMLVIGVDFPVLWAFIIFLFNFIPYVGSFVATFLPSIFAVVQFGSLWYFVYVFIAVETVQILVGNYIEPRVMGRSLNLSPLVVMITLTFWGLIWGVLGMILSVPIVSVLTIVLAQFPNSRKIAIMLSETGDIDSYLVHKEAKNTG
jgi:AI-2 transport protein TqsA